MAPARNRVTPTGDIEALDIRGAWTGNRGIVHRDREIVRFHASDLWITCALQFKDWGRPQWLPGRWTHLFFLDEAVSFAAGHRPCATCRRADYNAYRTAWAAELGCAVPTAKEMNRQLHSERIVRGTHRRRLHQQDWANLPDGSFVMLDETPALVVGDQLVEWTKTGYGTAHVRPRSGMAAVLTPPSSLAVLRGGYPLQIDARATTASRDQQARQPRTA